MAITYNEAGVSYDDPGYTYDGDALATMADDEPIHIIAIASPATHLTSTSTSTHLISRAPAPTTLPSMRLAR